MKTTVGYILIVFGVVAGLWVGIWWGFIGGIIQLIESFKGSEIQAFEVALGLARIFFANIAGWATAICFWFVGLWIAAELSGFCDLISNESIPKSKLWRVLWSSSIISGTMF